ncbi:hypothetical protein [Paenibacillus massiliensis]|nr:hypothetical protein [Paenibacillus massiliensis]
MNSKPNWDPELAFNSELDEKLGLGVGAGLDCAYNVVYVEV